MPGAGRCRHELERVETGFRCKIPILTQTDCKFAVQSGRAERSTATRGALGHRAPSHKVGGRDRGQDGTGRAAAASRRDEDCLLQGRPAAARLRAYRIYVLRGSPFAPEVLGAKVVDSSPRSNQRSAANERALDGFFRLDNRAVDPWSPRPPWSSTYIANLALRASIMRAHRVVVRRRPMYQHKGRPVPRCGRRSPCHLAR